MTAPVTMNALIHRAVRRDLGRLAAALDPWQDGDRARARDLERAFANLRRELSHHHEGEDAHVWPHLAAAGVRAELLGEMEAEHAAMSTALAETGTALRALAATAAGADAAAARASVARTRAVVDGHLDHEEAELGPLLRTGGDGRVEGGRGQAPAPLPRRRRLVLRLAHRRDQRRRPCRPAGDRARAGRGRAVPGVRPPLHPPGRPGVAGAGRLSQVDHRRPAA